MIRGVLFDKDDTLIDLAAFWRAPIRATVRFICETLDHADDTALCHALTCACGFDGDTLIGESPVVAGTNADVIASCMAVLKQYDISTANSSLFSRLCETYLEYACLRDGILRPTGDLHAVLETLCALGCKIGVVTSDSYTSTTHALRKLGILDAIDLVLTADRVAHPKPAPDMAEIFCARFALSPDEVVMVGDSNNDIRFARNAGLTAVLFDCSTHTTESTADFIIHDLESLPVLLRSL